MRVLSLSPTAPWLTDYVSVWSVLVGRQVHRQRAGLVLSMPHSTAKDEDGGEERPAHIGGVNRLL